MSSSAFSVSHLLVVLCPFVQIHRPSLFFVICISSLSILLFLLFVTFVTFFHSFCLPDNCPVLLIVLIAAMPCGMF